MLIKKEIKNFISAITCLVFSLFFTVSTFGQSNYQSGYLINLKGDTLKGYIDYRNWGINPGKISFKKTTNDQAKVYTPLDVKKFWVADELYEGGIVKIETSTRNITKLTYLSELQFRQDTVFLQAAMQGVKDLYYYKDKNRNLHFFIKQDSVLELLIFKKYFKQVKNKRVLALNHGYIGQLSLYFRDCPGIQSNLSKVEYTLESLQKLFLDYYTCSGNNIVFQKGREKNRSHFGIIGGLSMTQLDFRGNLFADLVDTDFPRSNDLSAGLFLDYILSRNQNKWSIYNELLFTSYKVRSQGGFYEHEDNYSTTETAIGHSYIKLNNLLRFKYPIKSVFLFVNAGLSNGLSIGDTNYKKEEVKFFSSERIEEGKVIDDMRKYEQGYIFGLGAGIKNFTLDIRFEYGNGFSDYTSLSARTKRYYFLLGYRF